MYLRIVLLSAVWSAAAIADHCSMASSDSDACAQPESTEGQSMSLLQTGLAVKSTQASVRAKCGPDGDCSGVVDETPCEKPHCDKATKTGHCTPRCAYSCTTPVCDETCEAECLKPECQTICPDLGPDTSDDIGKLLANAGYKFECKKPECEVQCPEKGCGANDCPGCKTVCHKPDCEMKCVAPTNNSEVKDTERCNLCETVCLQPKCKWNCKEPTDCPKPECKMHCEVATGCSKTFSDTGANFPSATDGMLIVDPAAGDAGGNEASLFQKDTSHAQTMTVKARRAVQIPGSDKINFVQEDLTLPRMS